MLKETFYSHRHIPHWKAVSCFKRLRGWKATMSTHVFRWHLYLTALGILARAFSSSHLFLWFSYLFKVGLVQYFSCYVNSAWFQTLYHQIPIKWLLFHWHFSKFNIICHPFLFQLQPTFRSLIGFLYIHNHKVPLLPCIFFSNSLDQLAKTSFKKSLKGLSEIWRSLDSCMWVTLFNN